MVSPSSRPLSSVSVDLPPPIARGMASSDLGSLEHLILGLKEENRSLRRDLSEVRRDLSEVRTQNSDMLRILSVMSDQVTWMFERQPPSASQSSSISSTMGYSQGPSSPFNSPFSR